MKKISIGKTTGLFILSLTLAVAGCTKKAPEPTPAPPVDKSANIEVQSFLYLGDNEPPVSLSGPYNEIVEEQKKDNQGNLVWQDADKTIPEMVKVKKPIEKLPELKLTVGDDIPQMTDTILADLPKKEVPADADEATTNQINKENAEIDKQNELRKQAVFVGWFKDQKGSTPVDFDEKVTKETKIIGVFKKPKPNHTMVSFRTEAGVAPMYLEVPTADGKVEQPANIVSKKTPRIMINAWKKPNGDDYDFSKSLAENGGKDALPITATWEPVKANYVVVNWVTDRGQNNLPFQMEKGKPFPKGQDIGGVTQNNEIPKNPVADGANNYATGIDGRAFENWTTDKELGTPFDFGTRVNDDLTLYAYWQPRQIALKFSNEVIYKSAGVQENPNISITEIPYGSTLSVATFNQQSTGCDIDCFTRKTIVTDIGGETGAHRNFKEWKFASSDLDQNLIFEFDKTKLFRKKGDSLKKVEAVYFDKGTTEIPAIDANQGLDNVAGVEVEYTDIGGAPVTTAGNTLANDKLTIGEYSTLPNTPKLKNATGSDEGKVFAGWYADEAGTKSFDYNEKVTNDTKRYAKWIKPAASNNVIVSFITEYGQAPVSQEVVETGKILVPEKNLKETRDDGVKRVFTGWYIKSTTAKYDWNKTIAENAAASTVQLTNKQDMFPLYAKWEVVPDGKFIVDFEVGNQGVEVLPVVVAKGATVNKPASPVGHIYNRTSATVANDRLFKVWGNSATTDAQFDFTAKIEEDTTIYGKWGTAYFNVIFHDDKRGTEVKRDHIKYGTVLTSGQIPTPGQINEATFRYWEKLVPTSSGRFNREKAQFSNGVFQDYDLYPKWKETVYKFEFEPGTLPKGMHAGTKVEAEKVLTANDSKLSNFPDTNIASAWKKFPWGTTLDEVVTAINLVAPGYSGVPGSNWFTGYTWNGWINPNDSDKPVAFNQATKVNAITPQSSDSSSDEETVVTIKLKGSWNIVENGTYTATFNLGVAANSGGTSASYSKPFALNTKVEKPASNPTNDNYNFVRWAAQDGGATDFVFDVNRNSDVTIYAVWEGKARTVTFQNAKTGKNLKNFGFGSETVTQSVVYPNKAVEPKITAPIPAHELIWATDATCTAGFNFDSIITADTTIYLCDKGYKKQTIVDQMITVTKDEDNKYSPKYDYKVFPYETTAEMYNSLLNATVYATLTTDEQKFAPMANISQTNMERYVSQLNTDLKDNIKGWKFVLGVYKEHAYAALAGGSDAQAYSGQNGGTGTPGDYYIINKGAAKPVWPSRKPNAFGLFDMSGNVAELVTDSTDGLGGHFEIDLSSAFPAASAALLKPVTRSEAQSGALGYDSSCSVLINYCQTRSPDVGTSDPRLGFRLYLIPDSGVSGRSAAATTR